MLELIGAYFKHKNPKSSPNTLESYTWAIKQFVAFTTAMSIRLLEVNGADFERFQNHLNQLRPSQHQENTASQPSTAVPLHPSVVASTQRHRLAAVSSLYRAFIWAGALSKNPLRAVRRPQDRTPAPEQFRVLSAEEMRALLLAPQQTHANDAARASRDTAILALGLLAGLRVSEIINLHTVDIRKSCVHLRDKGRGKRQMPLLGWLAASLRSWRKLRPQTNGGSSALIVSLSTRNFGMPLSRQHTWAIVSGYFAHLKLERREQLGGVDALRRAAASNLFRAAQDAAVVRAILDMVGPSNKPVGIANLDEKIKEALAKADDQLNFG